MVLIVAEVGVNHNGSVDLALDMAHAAKSCGADAVKFQLFDSRKLWGDDRIAHLELSRIDMRAIADYCGTLCIEFMCTPFGVEEVEFLAPMVKRMKIASGCINRTEILAAVNRSKVPAVLSTGMSDLHDIRVAVSRLDDVDHILHCTSAYPCPFEEANLSAMDRIAVECNLPVGYSDHTEGVAVAIGAAALGATMIEKHFTLDRYQVGPDHKASIEPADFARMVAGIRQVEAALGNGVKSVEPSERKLKEAWGR